MKFEHCFVDLVIYCDDDAEDVNNQLDKMGQEGWELVSTIWREQKYGLFFKRPVEE